MEKVRYTKKRIEKIALKILESFYGTDKYPISVAELAENMGLQVFRATFNRDDISGMLEANKKTIYVCQNDSATRQRFSVAHEIGHYVLHYKGDVFDEKDNEKHISFRDNRSTLGFDIKEIEANFFAASILMPEKKVTQLYNEGYSLTQMADFFGVSITAMGHRLDFLGYEV